MDINVLYTCRLCGLDKVTVKVNSRGEEDVIEWMDGLLLSIADDHKKRSPNCQATKIYEVMIPIIGADKIGGPTVH